MGGEDSESSDKLIEVLTTPIVEASTKLLESNLSENGKLLKLLFRAIETNDLRWMNTHTDKLPSVLSERQAHRKEGAVTPLEYAAIKGNIEAFKTLYKLSNALSPFKLIKFFLKHGSGDVQSFEEMIKILNLDLNLIVTLSDNEKNNLLHIACSEKRVEVIKKIIELTGVRFTEMTQKTNSEGQTPLITCTRFGAEECLEILLDVSHFDMKTDLDSVDSAQDTAMHVASRNGYANIVKSLLSNGASVDKKNKDKLTPLRIAIDYRHTNVIEVILNDENWELALKTGTKTRGKQITTATESLIKDFPDMAEIVMDNCCTKDEKDNFVFDIKFHEEFRGDSDDCLRKSFRTTAENPVSLMIKKNHEQLFTHPLALIHLRHEFQHYGVYHYLWRFLYLLLFGSVFKSFIMKQYNPSDEEVCEMYTKQCGGGTSNWSFCKVGTHDNVTEKIKAVKDSNIQMERWLTVLFVCRLIYFFAFYEVVQLVHVKYWYKGGELFEKVLFSFLEMVYFILAICVVWDENGPQDHLASCTGWKVGVGLLPLIWIHLFFLSKNFLFIFPFMGKYVLVFYAVLLKTVLVAFMLLMPTYGFVYAFHCLFKRTGLFEDMTKSTFKSVTMLFGEFDLGETFWPEEKVLPEETATPPPFFWISLSMIYLFMIIMCAAVMNTFISIAVDNISDYHKNAVLKDQLSALQEYDTPTLMSKLFYSRIESMNLQSNLDNKPILYRCLCRVFYFFVPEALFTHDSSMKLRLKQEDFYNIIRNQYERYEINSDEQRRKFSDLVQKMKKSKDLTDLIEK